MPRFFYQPAVRLTQAQITAGDATALDSVKVIVVDGSGIATGVIYESGPAGTSPTQVSTAASSILNNFAATTAPTVGDDSGDGYAVGSRWVDVTADESYICVDASVGAAVWSRTTVGTIAEVSGLQTALDAKAPTASPTFTGTVSGVTAAHVGLGNVANTSDANKPVSTAQQTALDAKQATLVSGTNIRTVNGAGLLGAGNVNVAADLPGGAAQTVTDEGLATTGSPTIDRATVPGETIVTFAASGTFTVPLGVTSARHLVVGGGGGGGGGESNSFGGAGGGGGGGNVVDATAAVVPGVQLAVTIGGGGTGGASLTADSSTNGNAGGQSAFGAVTANGGGGGGGDANTPSGSRNGANSGGGAGDLNFAPGTAEAGGFAGGTGGSGRAGAGGGGDGGVGENAGVDGTRQGGDGGIGTASNITGASITYAGGAGGGGNSNGGTALGGTGADGGGNGDTSANNTTGAGSGGSVGAANRGGGGGGATGRGGFTGGSGVVIVRFATQTRSYQALSAFADDVAARAAGLRQGDFYFDAGQDFLRQVQP